MRTHTPFDAISFSQKLFYVSTSLQEDTAVMALLEIDRDKLQALVSGTLNPDETVLGKVETAYIVIRCVAERTCSIVTAREWLMAHNKHLAGISPFDAIRLGRTDDVLAATLPFFD